MIALLQNMDPPTGERVQDRQITTDVPTLNESPTVNPIRQLPDKIGPYEIQNILGEGGMGCVYLGLQRWPVERQVAIKLIRSSLVSPKLSQRFLAERRAMARLSHPHVAQILEANQTDDGFPYFVMEYIPGTPLTRYCDQRRLSLEGRLDLVASVCHGVDHAHRRGIIHRDLKPTNILVMERAGRPIPKIIDFGIAKAFDKPLTDSTQLTGELMLGTPAYMSPEAFRSYSDDEPDWRTDIYALGVILYELVSGRRPFDLKGDLLQLLWKVTRQDPPPPSQRWMEESPFKRSEIAHNRGTKADDLHHRLVNDLDRIVVKAIAREREDRYESAAELAMDIDRYLRQIRSRRAT